MSNAKQKHKIILNRYRMQSLNKYTIFLFFLFLSNSALFAQHEYTSSNPKAVKFFEVAAKYYDGHKNEKALEAIDEAIKADPKFIEAHMLKANIFTDLKEHEKAIASYKDAIAINPDFFPNNFFSLAKAEYVIGNYLDAKSHLEKFITYPKVKGNLLWKAKRLIANAEFANTAVNNPIPFAPVNMGDSINSINEEYFPTITADGMTFLFTRRLKTESPDGGPLEQEDFYKSTKSAKGWGRAIPLSEINTGGNEGAPALSADGQYLFFTACEELLESMGALKTKGSCDIFLSKKVGDKFTEPRNLEEPVNTGTWESQPSFSSDGRTLYFVRRINGAGKIGPMQNMPSYHPD